MHAWQALQQHQGRQRLQELAQKGRSSTTAGAGTSSVNNAAKCQPQVAVQLHLRCTGPMQGAAPAEMPMAGSTRVVPKLLVTQASETLRCGGCSQVAEGGLKLPKK